MGEVSSIRIEIQTNIDTFEEVEAAQVAHIPDANKPANKTQMQVINDLHEILSTYSSSSADKRSRIHVPVSVDRSLSCVVNRAELSDPWHRRDHYDQRITCEEYQITESAQQQHSMYAATRVYFLSGYVYHSDEAVDFIPIDAVPNTSSSAGAAVSVYEYRPTVVRRPAGPAIEQPYIERP